MFCNTLANSSLISLSKLEENPSTLVIVDNNDLKSSTFSLIASCFNETLITLLCCVSTSLDVLSTAFDNSIVV